MLAMWHTLVDMQREIYQAFGAQIRLFATEGSWRVLAGYLPMGILLGAVHALTPGHSKSILAAYLAGAAPGLVRGLVVSWALAFTHIAMAVLIALLSLPLVSMALGSVGRTPLLDDLSRGLLGLIGLWMLWQGLRGHRHARAPGTGLAVGLFAGLVPCPLTLFVMTYATARGVPEAGIAFAVVMLAGVACTLSLVALVTVLFRRQLEHLLATRPRLLGRVARALAALTGAFLVLVAVNELLWR